jgi:hypothetical protein
MCPSGRFSAPDNINVLVIAVIEVDGRNGRCQTLLFTSLPPSVVQMSHVCDDQVTFNLTEFIVAYQADCLFCGSSFFALWPLADLINAIAIRSIL